ncbi:MAG TPA: hypothetical protein VEY30_10930 [Myxococcaceae bacterium]|nr:hypothetical protein [Myxococcaceae bacterium]
MRRSYLLVVEPELPDEGVEGEVELLVLEGDVVDELPLLSAGAFFSPPSPLDSPPPASFFFDA